MKLLAIDTSSVACSVALAYGGEISERYEEQPREHTRLLVPMIESVLQDAGLELAQLDAIVLGNGPGSFIGMRIAASVAQGLAHGAGLGIVPVSSLAAVAAEVFTDRPEEYVAVAQDAHMSEVYFGLFRRDANGLPEAVIPERIQAQEAIAELVDLADGSAIAAGDGWNRYPQLLEANRDALQEQARTLYPRARHLLPLGEVAFAAQGALQAAEIQPAYLREKVAEPPAP